MPLRPIKITKLETLAIVGVLMLLIGLSVVGPTLISNFEADHAAAANAVNTSGIKATLPQPTANHPVQTIVSGYPVSISFPSLGITKNLVPGYYDASTNSWTLSDVDAQYATITVEPNNTSGQTFIYGHALRTVFGPLLAGLHIGDIAQITTQNGYVFTYKLTSSYPVSPSDTSVLNYSGAPRLLVQTCSGLFWQNRQMFSFEYLGYTKN